MSKEWFKFQEVICDYFKSIGAEAKTNVSVQGVRTSHDIDILVKISQEDIKSNKDSVILHSIELMRKLIK